jgi:1,4-dihydroxy-2-naphthoate octaprenyltransferase
MLKRIASIIRSEAGDKGLKTTSNIFLGIGGICILLYCITSSGIPILIIGLVSTFVGLSFRMKND